MSEKDEYGVNILARQAFGSMLAEPMPQKETHLRTRSRRGFERAWCRSPGTWLTDARDAVTCEKCKREAKRRQKRRGRAKT